jgi:pimeloyl-ACP methyl ester carboxylesterase
MAATWGKKWLAFKQALLQKALDAEAKAADLCRKQIRLSFGEVAYFEKTGSGNGRTLVLLHGAGANKNSWCRFAKHLSAADRVIVPDLPGHGDSVQSLSLGYSIAEQTQYLHELLTQLHATQIHLVGNSMGATVAIIYTHIHPDLVQSLILIDAGGVERTPSEMRREIERTGIHPMMAIDSVADYKRLVRYGMNKPPYIPNFFLKLLAADKISRRTVESKVFNDVLIDLDQTAILPTLRLPTLIIWGKLDRIVHVDDADLLHEQIKNSEKVILDDIGHVPMVEAPQATAMRCTAFWTATNKQQRAN